MALEFVENKRPENPGEIHLPCIVLVDTSGSMGSAMKELNEGLVAMGEAIKEDSLAVGRVEYSIITFNDKAQVVVPFGPAYDYEAPRLECGGMTAMHEAIDLALDMLEKRKREYEAGGIPYLRPWIFMMTDGKPNDVDNGSFERLIQAQKEKHCTFFPMGIGGDYDKNTLKYLSTSGIVLSASKDNFKESFVWLSNSVSTTSSSRPDEKVNLPNPGDYQITIEA